MCFDKQHKKDLHIQTAFMSLLSTDNNVVDLHQVKL